MIYQCAVFSVFIAVVAAAASSTGSLVKMADVRKVSKITPEANDGSTVWVKNTFYEDSCSGKTIKTIYYSTSVCWSTDTGSMSFSCDIGGGSFNQTFYSDTACTTMSTYLNIGVGNCLLNDVDDDGYLTDDGAWDFNEYTCTTSTPSPLSGASVSQSLYASTSCDSTELFMFDSLQQEQCYSNYDGTSYTSFQIDVPYGISFTGIGCAPANVSTITYQAVDVCSDFTVTGTTTMYQAYGSDDDDDDEDDDNKINTSHLTTRDKLGLCIGFGFLGGLIVATWFMYCFCHKKQPMAKEDNINNI